MKILSILLMSVMILTVASAYSIQNVETFYNKSSNQVKITYDKILNKECNIREDFKILDHKANVVVNEYYPYTPICAVISSNGRVMWDNRKTGTFHTVRIIDMPKHVIGKGNLEYQMFRHSNQEIVSSGRIK